MNFYIAWCFSLCTLLTACGGSTTSVSETAQFTTLKQFSDSAGVARGVYADGTETVFIASNVAGIVTAANKSVGTTVGATTTYRSTAFSGVPVTQRLSSAVVRRGTVVLEGQTANVLIVQENNGQAGLVYMAAPSGDILTASGTAFGAAPNGVFTYNGTHIIAERSLGGGAQDGTFSLQANFNNKTFSYNGKTTSTALTGSGTIDTVRGRISSNNLSSNVNGVTSTATLYGQLHGTVAQSTSGVFHTNEADPNYAGAFVGSR